MIRRLNLAEPVTLVRSPTLTNRLSLPTLNGSRPDRRKAGAMVRRHARRAIGHRLGNRAMCSGEVPQQPPTMLSRPERAHSPICSAICAPVSS
jgi:hypothetical protein